MDMNTTYVQGNVVRSSREPGIVCHEVFYDSGQTLAAHAHTSAFIAFSLDGKYRETVCGAEFECTPRTIVFHPAGEEHAIQVGDAILRCFIVELDPNEMLRRYDVHMPSALLHVDSGPMAGVLTSLYGEFRHP